MRFLRGPSRLGNIFIAIGLVLLLYIPVSWGWTEFQGMELRSQLEAEATPAATSAPLAALPVWSPVPSHPPALPTLAPATTVPTQPPTLEAESSGSGGTAPSEPGPSPFAVTSATAASTQTAIPTASPAPTEAPLPTSTPEPAGPPIRIVFPDLHIDGKVTPMGWQPIKTASGSSDLEWQVPEYSAGWAITSSPLGVPGNTVLSAHNNIYGMLFRPISLVWPDSQKQEVDAATYSTDILNGRKIMLYAADGQVYQYQVTGFYRLHDSGVTLEQRAANANYMQQTPDPELTLITCWPPWSNTYRLIVRAKLAQ